MSGGHARARPLQPWHTQVLHEEFKADQAGEVRDLAGYLRVEERLFAEMDAEVYAVTPTGPDQALVRFSPGSASDPRDRVPNWNRTFEIGPADAPAGVLLLHGMSDGPYSLRALGEALAGQGYRVLGLRLPGHGTIPSAPARRYLGGHGGGRASGRGAPGRRA